MQKIENKAGEKIVRWLAEAIAVNKDELSRIDGETGDGDHGINMNKGFAKARDYMEEAMTIDQALEKLGTVLVDEIGGSMGPIYGTFFLKIASVLKDKETIDKGVFLEALQNAQTGIMELTGAERGDKTLLDTLIPAVDSYKNARGGEEDFKEALERMKEAAYEGMVSTREMKARVGRASRLGERSRGSIDAGAASCYIILDNMAENIIRLLE